MTRSFFEFNANHTVREALRFSNPVTGIPQPETLRTGLLERGVSWLYPFNEDRIHENNSVIGLLKGIYAP